MLILLIMGGGGPEFGKTCLSNSCTLPYELVLVLGDAVDFMVNKCFPDTP